jgi:hypothetical protein
LRPPCPCPDATPTSPLLAPTAAAVRWCRREADASPRESAGLLPVRQPHRRRPHLPLAARPLSPRQLLPFRGPQLVRIPLILPMRWTKTRISVFHQAP